MAGEVLRKMTEKTFLYFGYGSNMLHERLQARCHSAKPIGVAYAQGYKLAFSKHSKDGSGKATIAKTDDKTDIVYGVLFGISEKELIELDKAEGYPGHYGRDMEFEVISLQDQETVVAATYIAQSGKVDHSLKPYDWYKALVLAGARQNKLDADYIENINSTQSISDPDDERKSRKDAIAVLKEAGFASLLS